MRSRSRASRRRPLSAVGAVAAVACAVAAPAPAPAQTLTCPLRASRLPDLGYGSGAYSVRGDTVVGAVTDSAGEDLAAEWRHGRLTVLRDAGPIFVDDVNRRGEVIGTSAGFTSAFAYAGGRLHDLPTDDHSFVYALRINDRGQIAGVAFGGLYAARWDSYASAPVRLAPAASLAFSFSKGINDRGAVAGDSDDPNGVPYATVWSASGVPRLLPSGFGAGQPGDLFAIDDAGEAVGESYATDPAGDIRVDRATAWSASGRPTLIPFLPETNQSTAFNVSDRGWVVGEAAAFDYATGAPESSHAWIWLGRGAARPLPVPGLSYAASQSIAHGVDDGGAIVGASGPADGNAFATVWTCGEPWRGATGVAATMARWSTNARHGAPTRSPRSGAASRSSSSQGSCRAPAWRATAPCGRRPGRWAGWRDSAG